MGEAGYTEREGSAAALVGHAIPVGSSSAMYAGEHVEQSRFESGPQSPPPDLDGLRGRSSAVEQHAPTVLAGGSIPSARATQAATVVAASVQLYASSVPLTEAEMIAVLSASGWPTELHSQALAVSWCESKWSPGAVGDGGNSMGLFQLNWLWFGYAGEDSSQWADPYVNARVAWATYNYDLNRGQRPWQQWTCKP